MSKTSKTSGALQGRQRVVYASISSMHRCWLVVATLLATTLWLRAATLQEIYGFPSGVTAPNPNGLVQGSDGALYGTTANGGSAGYGTVFRITTNGALTPLASFADTNGSNPQAALVQGKDGAFYGTTFFGGSSGLGTVFRMTANGALSSLASFGYTNGAYPEACLAVGSDRRPVTEFLQQHGYEFLIHYVVFKDQNLQRSRAGFRRFLCRDMS